jgi:death-on-curing protein
MIDITKDEIIDLNKRIVREFGGSFGMPNESNLDFVLAKAANSKDVFRKAAVIMHGINEGHPFVDGNKRTAFESAKILLLANGVELKFQPNEVEDFMVKMAQPKSLTLQEVEIWIKEHSDKNGKADV